MNMTRRISPRFTLLLVSCITGTLFLASCSTPRHAAEGRSVDFSHYDEPLYDQIADHIKARVMARLGEGRNNRDRYFIIPFGYENEGNDPVYSHSFISVIRVFADGKQPKLTPELRKRTYKGREFEAFTVSWLPRDF